MSSKAQAKKDEIISELVETRRKIVDAAAALSAWACDIEFHRASRRKR